MILVLAIVIGVLWAASIYMLMRRSIVRLLIGLVLIGHAANLLLLAANGPQPDRPPLLHGEGAEVATAFADPLPQALVLTAIVISFGLTALAVGLVRRTHEVFETDDVARVTERHDGRGRRT